MFSVDAALTYGFTRPYSSSSWLCCRYQPWGQGAAQWQSNGFAYRPGGPGFIPALLKTGRKGEGKEEEGEALQASAKTTRKVRKESHSHALQDSPGQLQGTLPH